MQQFEQSTQYRFWLFDEATLQTLRENACEASSQRLEMHQSSENSEQLQEELKAGIAFKPSDQAAVTRYYEKLLWQTKAACSLTAKATCCIFFKRFFMRNCVTDFPPDLVLCVCFLLGCKAEDDFRVLERCRDAKKPELFNGANKLFQDGTVIRMELVVLAELRFHLRVFHPFRALDGLAEPLLASSGPLFGAWNQAIREAKRTLESSYLTDALLLFSPAQIALSALRKAAEASPLAATLRAALEMQMETEAKYDRLEADAVASLLALTAGDGPVAFLLQQGLVEAFGNSHNNLDKRTPPELSPELLARLAMVTRHYQREQERQRFAKAERTQERERERERKKVDRERKIGDRDADFLGGFGAIEDTKGTIAVGDASRKRTRQLQGSPPKFRDGSARAVSIYSEYFSSYEFG
jgi:hypothetical protein